MPAFLMPVLTGLGSVLFQAAVGYAANFDWASIGISAPVAGLIGWFAHAYLPSLAQRAPQ